jgi:hypothetical protein
MLATQTKTDRGIAVSSFSAAVLGIRQTGNIQKRVEVPVSVPSIPAVCTVLKSRSDARIKIPQKRLVETYSSGNSANHAAKLLGVTHPTVLRNWAFYELPLDALRSKIPDSLFEAARWNEPNPFKAAKLLGVKTAIVKRRWALMDAESKMDTRGHALINGRPPAVSKLQLISAKEKGLTSQEAADLYGADRSTISKAWKRLGLTSNTKKTTEKKTSADVVKVSSASFNGIPLRTSSQPARAYA